VTFFLLISHPLTALTKKDCKWKRGPLPQDALNSFRELQTILCSEPVINYPRKNRPYVLITDASFGDEKTPGGFGAILTQVGNKNEHRVIAFASPFSLRDASSPLGNGPFPHLSQGKPFHLDDRP
jgi:hypothetical protein